MWFKTFEHAVRAVKIVAGFTVLALGVAMLVLPGPGLVTIALGLAILSAEFGWARRLLDRLKSHARHIGDSIRGR
jgi:tellurite resistance protein TerC